MTPPTKFKQRWAMSISRNRKKENKSEPSEEDEKIPKKCNVTDIASQGVGNMKKTTWNKKRLKLKL